VRALIGELVAGVDGARDAVAARDGCAGLAAGEGVARFGAVAEQAVAASRVARRVIARIGRLVAGVDGAGDRVRAIWRCSGLAAGQYVARLDAVAELAVVAERIARRVAANGGSR